jgi:hypothetical protein
MGVQRQVHAGFMEEVVLGVSLERWFRSGR